jgi:hypothetical protein
MPELGQPHVSMLVDCRTWIILTHDTPSVDVHKYKQLYMSHIIVKLVDVPQTLINGFKLQLRQITN